MAEKEDKAKEKGITQKEIDVAQSLVNEALSRTGIKRIFGKKLDVGY